MTDYLLIVAADWQHEYLPRMDTPEGQSSIEPLVENADVIIFDNRSCLFDPEGEKDPTAWQPTQDYLLSQRRRDKASLLAEPVRTSRTSTRNESRGQKRGILTSSRLDVSATCSTCLTSSYRRILRIVCARLGRRSFPDAQTLASPAGSSF